MRQEVKEDGSIILPSPVQAVLFDIDGTLADTDPVHARTWREALSEVHGSTFTLHDYLNACVHGSMKPADFLRTRFPRTDFTAVERRKRELYNHLLPSIPLNKGVDDLVYNLERVGTRMALVSSSSAASTDAFVRLRWPGPKPVVVVSREGVRRPKPHPEPYLVATRELGISPDDTAAVEDSSAGELSALAAGCWAFSTNETPREKQNPRLVRIQSLANLRVERIFNSTYICVEY